MLRPLSCICVASFLIGLAGSPSAAWAQRSQSGFEVSGYVREDARDQPVGGVRIELKFPDEQVVFPAILSSSGGEFRFNGVREGNYLLVIQGDGYEPARISLIVQGMSGSHLIVRLHRLPVAATTAPPGGDTTTVHQLNVPPKAREAFDKGMKLLNGKADARKGIAHFERAIEIFPGYYEAYAQMGVAHDMTGNAAAAEQAFRKSIQISSGKYAEAQFLLVEMLNERERFAEAETIAREEIATEPSSWRGHYELARALVGLNQNGEGEASAKKARELKPDYLNVYLLLANIHKRQQNYAALVQDLDAFLNLAPGSATSDQARAMRDQAKKSLEEQQKQASPMQSKP